LDERYEARIKVLDEHENEIQEEIKALSPSKKEKQINYSRRILV
tara:strand:- start:139 stop:270 length:132 start_codon:yes stop_codon:yes gene_type:complete